MKRILFALLVAPLSTSAPAQHPAFDPIAFFNGRTQGEGQLKKLFTPARRIVVDSNGTLGPDGWLTLTQKIQEERHPARVRTWRFRSVGTGRFEGMLSDAKGPVTIQVEQGRAHIRYRDHSNLLFNQWLTPRGPRHVRNHMTVTRLGVRLATLDEDIRKLD